MLIILQFCDRARSTFRVRILSLLFCHLYEFDAAANALASAQVNFATSIVFVTPLILNYLLKFYATPAMFYKHYFLNQQVEIII